MQGRGDGQHEPLTPIVFHILLALADRPLHGYAIMQAVEESSGGSLSTGPGTVYGSLSRLEESGLVREVPAADLECEPAPTGRGRPRKYFRLTEAGMDSLRAEALRLDRLTDMLRAKRILTDEAGT